MTPCEELGYKVEDLFEVIESYVSDFSKGSVVKLLEDDKTGAPLFQLIKGGSYSGCSESYEVLRYVKPLPNLPTGDFKINLSNMTEAEKKVAKEWLKKVAESRGTDYEYMTNSKGQIGNYVWVQELTSKGCSEGFNSSHSTKMPYEFEHLPELSLSFTTPEVKGWGLSDNKSEKEAQLRLQLEQTIDKLQAALEEAEEQLQSIKNN